MLIKRRLDRHQLPLVVGWGMMPPLVRFVIRATARSDSVGPVAEIVS